MSLNSSRTVMFPVDVPGSDKSDSNNDDLEREYRRQRLEQRLSSGSRQRLQCENDANTKMTNYLQLFSENKIVASNAWLLNAIDCLKYVVDSNVNDILHMGPSSLEVGTKVFIVRVDDTFNEGVKFSHGLSSKVKNRNREEEDGGDSQENDGNRSDDDHGEHVRKKKKTPVSYVAKNLNEIDGEILTKKSVFRQIRTCLNDKGEKYFMGSLQVDSFTCCQQLVCTAFSDKEDSNDNSDIHLELPNCYSNEICKPLSNFCLRNVDKNVSSVFDGLGSTFSTDNNGHPMPDVSFLPNEVHDDDHFANNDDHEEIVQDRIFITELIPTRDTIGAKSDYSHSTLMRTNYSMVNVWAGPKHWKLKLLTRKGTHARNEHHKPLKRAFMRRKEEFCDFYGLEYDLGQYTVNHKIERQFPYFDSDDSLSKKFIFPENYNISKQMISSLVFDDTSLLVKHCNVASAKEVHIDGDAGDLVERPHDNTHIFDDNLEDANYNYENPNDSQFSIADEEPSTNMGMVTAPGRIREIRIDYDHNPSHIDIKKLKFGIKSLIFDGDLDEVPPSKRAKAPIDFLRVYARLPDSLPPKMRLELDPTVAFSGLLQVAYETNLSLRSVGSTILITKDEG